MAKGLLSIQGVTKEFAAVRALDDVSIEIRRGDLIGLVGSNGAGKTTLLRLMCGLYRPSTGKVLFHSGGESLEIDKLRDVVGVVPESTGLYHRLTAWENIRYSSRLHGIPDEVAWSRTQHFAKALALDEELMRHTRGFSRGMRQKTALLRALAHGPEILLLDEPTAGLDVTSARLVRRLVQKLRDEGGTVIYSTHNLFEAEKICDRILIMHNGEIRFDGTPAELMSATDSTSLEEAYIQLTQDSAREQQNVEQESWFAKTWRRFLTGSRPPDGNGGSEDE